MNPNESEFENQLRLLRPRAASDDLDEKVAAALGSPEFAVAKRFPATAVLRREARADRPRLRWWQGLGWSLAGALAAMVALALVFRGGGEKGAVAEVSAPAAVPGEFEQTETTESLVTTEDEGLVLDAGEEPVRQMHYYTLERHVWTNPQTGARMEFEIPREDVRLMPVAMQ